MEDVDYTVDVFNDAELNECVVEFDIKQIGIGYGFGGSVQDATVVNQAMQFADTYCAMQGDDYWVALEIRDNSGGRGTIRLMRSSC